MKKPPRQSLLGVLAALAISASPLWAQVADLDEMQEKAMKAAVLKVAPSVVQIETSGGTDLVGSGPNSPQVRKGTGPTTGLIVSPDGYIISSAFNFANKPAGVFVSVPRLRERFPAKVVATDQTRMLTLLKIESAGLPVPAAAPKKDIKVGQWSLAVGRTWSLGDAPPSVSVGIISALDRIWGKAIQTDAKVSPVNYGGPLVDLQGRVQGVLVPASPRGEGDTAGVEWYDSGIGFAIPLEDINAVLPRLKEGQDLQRGWLGVMLQSQDIYGVKPVIASVAPESAAAKAGIKGGDTVTEINGVKVVRQAQIQHLLGPKYEGDVVSVKVERGGKEVSFPNLKLAGLVTSAALPFLGILPLRDDPELGLEIRYVYPKSPAEGAGLKAGDRIMKAGADKASLQAFSGREQLANILNPMAIGADVVLEVRKQGAKDSTTLTVKLAGLQDAVPEKLPQPASLKKALEPRKNPAPAQPKPPMPPMPPKKDEPKKEEPKKEEPKKKPETGAFERSNAVGDHQYFVYVPDNYDPNIAHALVIWLHPSNKGNKKDFEALVDAWQDYCSDEHLILVCPKAQNERGWLFSEADFVADAARDIINAYTIDRRRVVAHGMGGGGQMAFYLGFSARDLIRGVATTGSVIVSDPKQTVANQPLSFYIVAGEKDPLAKSIAETKDRIAAQKFPVAHRVIADMGHQYLDEKTLAEIVRWIDSLDRQ